jgi:hypothetical protein
VNFFFEKWLKYKKFGRGGRWDFLLTWRFWSGVFLIRGACVREYGRGRCWTGISSSPSSSSWSSPAGSHIRATQPLVRSFGVCVACVLVRTCCASCGCWLTSSRTDVRSGRATGLRRAGEIFSLTFLLVNQLVVVRYVWIFITRTAYSLQIRRSDWHTSASLHLNLLELCNQTI